MVGLWTVDVSVSSIALNSGNTENVIVQSMFVNFTPRISYHIGLLLSTVAFLSITFILIIICFENGDKIEKTQKMSGMRKQRY